MSEANHDAASRPMDRIVTRDDLGGNEIEIAALPEQALKRISKIARDVLRNYWTFHEGLGGASTVYRENGYIVQIRVLEDNTGETTTGEPARRLG